METKSQQFLNLLISNPDFTAQYLRSMLTQHIYWMWSGVLLILFGIALFWSEKKYDWGEGIGFMFGTLVSLIGLTVVIGNSYYIVQLKLTPATYLYGVIQKLLGT